MNSAMQSHDQDQIVGILLAAGKGMRFDPSGAQNKLLQTTIDGDTVVVAAATALLAVLPRVTAVVRHAEDAVAMELAKLGCQVVVCPDADQGMGASLVCALEQNQDAAGWLIALGDMPGVQTTTIAALANELKNELRNGAAIVVPYYKGERGNPVGFGRQHLPELLTLGGDQGARSLLKAHPLTKVEVNDPGIHYDIDTAADLQPSS
ncbi:molybdopterin-guanine dinucleotide biosynthesis protein MobA [compost metagenome]